MTTLEVDVDAAFLALLLAVLVTAWLGWVWDVIFGGGDQ